MTQQKTEGVKRALDEACRFKIGDLVVSAAHTAELRTLQAISARLEDLVIPLMVYERRAVECHGGVQIHYSLGTRGEWRIEEDLVLYDEWARDYAEAVRAFDQKLHEAEQKKRQELVALHETTRADIADLRARINTLSVEMGLK